jgi:hypothetical protein
MNTFYRFTLILGTFFISIGSASASESFSDPLEITPVHFSPITKLASKIIYNHSAENISAIFMINLGFLVTWETLGKKLQRTIAPKAPKDTPHQEISKPRTVLGWGARFIISAVVGFVSAYTWLMLLDKVTHVDPVTDSISRPAPHEHLKSLNSDFSYHGYSPPSIVLEMGRHGSNNTDNQPKLLSYDDRFQSAHYY